MFWRRAVCASSEHFLIPAHKVRFEEHWERVMQLVKVQTDQQIRDVLWWSRKALGLRNERELRPDSASDEKWDFEVFGALGAVTCSS